MQAWDHRSCLVHAKKKLKRKKISFQGTKLRIAILTFSFRFGTYFAGVVSQTEPNAGRGKRTQPRSLQEVHREITIH